MTISPALRNVQCLGAELQIALNLITAHTWYALPSGALTFLNERGSDYLGLQKDHPLRQGINTEAAWDSHTRLLHPDDHEETRRLVNLSPYGLRRRGQLSGSLLSGIGRMLSILLCKRNCLMAVSLDLITDNRHGWSEHEDNQANCHIQTSECRNDGEGNHRCGTDK